MGSVRIGQYVYYEVDMSGAGMGVLTATCRGEVSKKIPVQITTVRHGVYRISFLPLSFGQYTLYIQWSGTEVPNSPFVYDLKPPHDIGKHPIEIPLSTPRIEDASAMKVTCTSQTYGVIAVNLVPVSANNYRISFKPQGPDIYTISVFYNSKHIKGSPFDLDLRVPDNKAKRKESRDITIDSKSSDSQKSSQYNAVIGTAFIVRIKSQETQAEGGRGIMATAVGKKVGESRIHVDQYSKRVTFNPKSADTYTLNISVNGDPVPQSPFTVHYSDPPSDPSRVNIIGLEDILSVLDINKEVSLVINPMKGGSGTLRAEVKGPKQAKVDVQARDGELGTYTVSFVPTAPGLYILSLFWNGEHIPNSPLKIRVVDTSSSVKTLPGKKVTIDDMEIKCGPTDIQAYALRRDSTKKLKVTVKQVKTHLYRFIFSHKEPGQYFIHIFVNGEELDVSPIPVYVSQQSWPKKCRVHNLPTVGYLNEEISVIINCTEGGEGTLEAKVTEPNKSEKSLAVVDNRNGTFTTVYVPTTEGKYSFSITWSGQEIGGSPYKLQVKTPTEYDIPVTNVSVVDLTGQSTSFTGGDQVHTSMNSYFEFNIQLTKKQAKIFIAKAIDEDGIYFDFSLLKITGNLFKYSFKPPSPGQYGLKFSLSDHTLKLPQLPSVIFFTEAEVDASKLKVLTHTISGLLLIDRQIFFQIDTRLAGNGKLKASLEGPSGDVPDLRLAPTPDTPHFYDVFFTPVVAGTYRLELMWSDTMVPGFPLVLHVTEPTIKYGESSSFDLQIDTHAKNISSFANHVDTGERYEVEIYQVSKRRYQFKFNPKISGKYNLHVLVNGKDISGSPFQLTYDHPPQAGNVVVTKLPKKAQVGSEVKFFINTQRAGNGHLNIKITGPESVEMQLNEQSAGVYKAEFTPVTTGVYTIKVTWSDEEVPKSPFELNVVDFHPGDLFIPPTIDGPSISPISTPAFPLSPRHDIFPSIIESDMIIFSKRHTLGKLSFSIIHNGFPDKLTIQFSGSTELPFKVIKGQRANKYEIDPKTAGKYDMVILWGGSVVGEVYTLYFELPKTIHGFNMQDQVFQVGKSYQFTITTDDISTGALEISCIPRDAADIVCTAVTSTQYQCSLIPKEDGRCKNCCLLQWIPDPGQSFCGTLQSCHCLQLQV
ncbi:Filamin-A [Geodia barretti]|uniref:Filamin-A n=1 Tax=Geodia barretti TaxID=519541 RepID=A0AA35TSC1_GEOBA|nr:Filamin-A [Geodia barretti]